MYRQRKRDLNLKPNRQLDKRSSRGMIYENEELRMRTIAICEDVDRGQNDIKKLRKENDHLKREIWGLRDECEKLEEMLKKVCISANIPEIQLEPKKSRGDNDDDDEDDEEDDDYGERRRDSRRRRASGTSVTTFDSEVGSCMSSMFDEDDYERRSEEEMAFAEEDNTSVIHQLGAACLDVMTTEAVVEQPPRGVIAFEHPHQYPSTSWAYHPGIPPPDLEAVKEETESNLSALNSPIVLTAPGLNVEEDPFKALMSDNFDLLPDPALANLPDSSEGGEGGLKNPVIQITPASSPINVLDSEVPQTPEITTGEADPKVMGSGDNVHNIGCITVVPKTFKVTSEIVVGENQTQDPSNPFATSDVALASSRSAELPRKSNMKKQDSGPTTALSKSEEISPPLSTTDHIAMNSGGGMLTSCHHRRSCYLPASSTGGGFPASGGHRTLGVFGSCCCSDFVNGYQSEPSLNSPSSSGLVEMNGGFTTAEDQNMSTSFFNSLCCRFPVPHPVVPAVTLRSVWNTVDKNIVIGFYDFSGGDQQNRGVTTSEPKVQEIVDELEAQFDKTLENICGIRVTPGRVFISLKSAAVVKAFLAHFSEKQFVVLKNVRIHFIEGMAKWSTLVLSGIPQEVSDWAVISVLNQFGQVVAPLDRRNYKGVDISERIAKMHLVISESSVPEYVTVSGYEVRIRVESDNPDENGGGDNKLSLLKPGQGDNPSGVVKQRKYGFVMPPGQCVVTTANNGAGGVSGGVSGSTSLKPHKPVIRSSSSAPRLETPAPHSAHLVLPSSAADPASRKISTTSDKVLEPIKNGVTPPTGQAGLKPPVSTAPGQGQQGVGSAPNLQTPPKKPLARLLVSSPGSFQPSPMNTPSSPDHPPNPSGHNAKPFFRNFDPRRGSGGGGGGQMSKFADSRQSGHALVTPSSSYSPKSRRKSSVQFAGVGKGGKREPLPWCGCWGLGCG